MTESPKRKQPDNNICSVAARLRVWRMGDSPVASAIPIEFRAG